MAHEDYTGTYSAPQEFSLSDSVKHMMMDMPLHAKESVEFATKQAEENPKDFIRYLILILGDYRGQLNTVITALVNEDILTTSKDEDDALSS